MRSPEIRSWKTILALAICLSLAAGTAFAKKQEKRAKVLSYGTDDGKEIKVEVDEKGGTAHVKIYEIKDGDEIKVTILRKGKKKTLEAKLEEREGFAYAFGDEEAPNAVFRRLQDLDGHDHALRLRRDALTPMRRIQEDEIDNLRADIAELRAMLEELKAEKE